MAQSPRGVLQRAGALVRREPWLLLCLAGALLLYQPFFAAGVPNTADGILHVFRSALWRWSWNDGVLWPRWSTLLHQGYGYPILEFNPPLLYAGSALLSLLTGSILTAFKAVLFLACLSYMLSMYAWARDVLGEAGAGIASIAYAFAAYRLRELYYQGNYQQFLAWSLFPWVLFCFHRLARQPGRAAFAGAVLSFAAVLLSHTISAMLFAVVLAAYGLCLAALYRRGAWRYVLAAGLVAGALTAVSWLPALAEARYTQVNVLTQGFFDVAAHFLRLRDILAPTPLLDYGAANPTMPYNFGLLALLLVAAGALLVFRSGLGRSLRWHLVFAIAGLLLVVFMMLPDSLVVWRSLPFIEFVEFPARLYGVALLFSSLLAGASVLWLSRWPRLRDLAIVLASLGLILAVTPYQFPRPFMGLDVTPASLVRAETERHILGTTSGDEFLSTWTTQPPQTAAITPDLMRTALVDPPAGVSADIVQATAQALTLRIDAQRPAEVTVAQFYFPGWQGRLDGASVALSAAPGSGLIRLQAPAGSHELSLLFGETPVRTAASLISALGLVALVVMIVRIPTDPPSPQPRRLRRSHPAGSPRGGEGAVDPSAPRGPEASDPSPSQGEGRVRADASQATLALALLVLGILLLKAAWLDHHSSLFRLYSPPGLAIPASRQMQEELGGQVALLGYDLDPATVRQGGEVVVRLYWQALQPLGRDYSSYVHLTAGPEQTTFAASDATHPGYIPTTSWHSTLYTVDEQVVSIPAAAPPVAMQVRVGLYDRETGARLGETVLPETVHVLAQPALVTKRIPVRAPTRFGQDIRLLGYGVQRLGDEIGLTLYWQATAQPGQDYQVFVHMLDATGVMVGQDDGVPVGGLYPTSQWLPGQIIADRHRLAAPGSGEAVTLAVGLYDAASGQRLPALKPDGSAWPDNAMTIAVPER